MKKIDRKWWTAHDGNSRGNKINDDNNGKWIKKIDSKWWKAHDGNDEKQMSEMMKKKWRKLVVNNGKDTVCHYVLIVKTHRIFSN